MGTDRHGRARALRRTFALLVAAVVLIGTACGGEDEKAATRESPGVSAEECVSLLRTRYADPANPPEGVDATEGACRRAGFDPVWEKNGIDTIDADYYEHFGVATSPEGSEPSTPAPDTTASPPTVTEPAKPASLMPDVVCMNLQDAQDLIQETGVFFSRSFDATGAGRNQVIDSNWVVVSQDPPAGTPIGEGDANLGAVKYGEPGAC